MRLKADAELLEQLMEAKQKHLCPFNDLKTQRKNEMKTSSEFMERKCEIRWNLMTDLDKEPFFNLVKEKEEKVVQIKNEVNDNIEEGVVDMKATELDVKEVEEVVVANNSVCLRERKKAMTSKPPKKRSL